jgi:hypothetical protein
MLADHEYNDWIPPSFAARLALVGSTLYGSRWKGPLARALGHSRITINRWVRGAPRGLDVDHELVALLAEIEARSCGLREAMQRFLATHD